ncbi:unnamed protein product (macronuclear) [Paramecium tetraurelia]|uniref:C2 domain-containing protein n=1 Tax=Paramecium tetraurelia TaxID=5888 RepID=A0BN97_PARTE|nr:uncharacterized protein GSPATT00030652001 [Paramecium tetraurelia]CAK60014.1 unnamed protein product [Paramecium tetraurelia]|eukprot:XP_001427412.1 hypothetical protein (macronuclear) [Paramecium tetraurelia strain d4-2]
MEYGYFNPFVCIHDFQYRGDFFGDDSEQRFKEMWKMFLSVEKGGANQSGLDERDGLDGIQCIKQYIIVMNTQLKILQFKYEIGQPSQYYFLIASGKEQYFTSTFKLQHGLNDFRDKFTLSVSQFIDFQLWDYWGDPVMKGLGRLDIQKVLKERKDMHIIQIWTDVKVGELMIQLIFEEEMLSLQSSLKEKSSFGLQPSFLSQQGASFYDNYLNDKPLVYMSASRSTQYRPTQSPVLQIKK